jgi:hypothetical protein
VGAHPRRPQSSYSDVNSFLYWVSALMSLLRWAALPTYSRLNVSRTLVNGTSGPRVSCVGYGNTTFNKFLPKAEGLQQVHQPTKVQLSNQANSAYNHLRNRNSSGKLLVLTSPLSFVGLSNGVRSAAWSCV